MDFSDARYIPEKDPNEPFSFLQAQQYGLHCANPSEQRIDFNASSWSAIY